MAYPQNKETFRRVINRDLSQQIAGTTLDKDDQNKPADFLERLQDTLGYNIIGEHQSLEERLNAFPIFVNIKKIKFFQRANIAVSSGISDLSTFGTIENLIAGDKISFIISFSASLNTSTTNFIIEPWYNTQGGTYTQLQSGIIIERTTISGLRGVTWITEKRPIAIETLFGIALKVVSGTGYATVRAPICIAIVSTD